MFENIDDSMRTGRRPEPEDEHGDEPINRRPRNFSSKGDMEKQIKNFLEQKFGGKAISVPGGIAMLGGDDREVHKPIYDKLNGIMKSMTYMAEQMGVKPSCKEATGKELKEGDVLKCPGGEKKTVLKVGYKFVVLSDTDDQKKVDGEWFEDEMNNLNFIKQP